MAANNANINVTPEELEASAGNIDGINTSLGEKLTNIKDKINQLCDGTWDSQAGEAIQERINNFYNNHFSQFQEAVARFTDYLRVTANDYREKEGALASNASKFQN